MTLEDGYMYTFELSNFAISEKQRGDLERLYFNKISYSDVYRGKPYVIFFRVRE